MILQELFQIAEKKDGEKIAMTVSGHLLKMLAIKTQIQYAKIETLFLGNEYLQTPSNHRLFSTLRSETEMCIKLGDCQPLLSELVSIGNL